MRETRKSFDEIRHGGFVLTPGHTGHSSSQRSEIYVVRYSYLEEDEEEEPWALPCNELATLGIAKQG